MLITEAVVWIQDFVVAALQRIEGISLATPDGAFYAMPDVSPLFGPGAAAEGFGPIADADALCRCTFADIVMKSKWATG